MSGQVALLPISPYSGAVRDEPEQEEGTEQEELQKDWEERLKERKKELRQISHQISQIVRITFFP